MAPFPSAGLAVGAEELQLFVEKITFGAEVAQIAPLLGGLLEFTLEDMFQGILHRTGTSP